LSQRKRTHPLVFFGWWTVFVTGTISGLGHGFNLYGLSVFFKDLAADLGLNRAITSLAAGIGRLEGGITSPLVGWLSDKFGSRWPVIVGIGIAGTGMILMNFITEVWHYYVAWGALIGLGLNIGLTVAVDKALTNWFVRRRGLAQGIKFALISLFGILVLQAVNALVLSQGWRTTCLIWGIVMFASVPFAFAFVKPQRPEYYGMLPDGADISPGAGEDESRMIDLGIGYASSFQETEYSFKQAIRTGTYWLLFVGFSVHNIISSGFTIHVIPFLTDMGITRTTASSMMQMMVFFMIPSRFFGGIIADRVRKSRLQFLLVVTFLLQVIGISIFLLNQNIASIYVWLICHGLSTGMATPVIILILGRYFGRKAFGSILGTMLACLAPLGLLAPVYCGWVHDTTDSYINAFITFGGLAMLSTITMFLVRAPRQPADGIN
jgi:MFS family permease